MLQSLDIPADDTSSAASGAKPVKLNAVVTKGHIRVVPKPGLKVVATGKADTASPPETVMSEPETVAPDSLDLEVTPAAPAPSMPWNDGFSEAPREAQSIESEPLLSQGPSMKMIKLIAAATVLGVSAIALTFLQFSGSKGETQGEGQVAAQSFNPVISAAGASTLPAVSALATTSATGGNSADIVAHITAGTLAALRNGSTETSSTGVAATPVATGESNGLYAMVLTALEQGQSRQYIDQMVNDAHRSQQVEVPAVLLTSTGEVNTGALLTLFGGQ
ncbi:hypothetical protein [Pseudophaeobacter sp. EL27]|uniref:hypothetical protein n=1 Tax=Pseudophaeobacter sp. EL27 TaxID=2107580 RepID=UPI0013C431C9|nr:hypothetical protein [Pseudophaeobacter sp. EL27]